MFKNKMVDMVGSCPIHVLVTKWLWKEFLIAQVYIELSLKVLETTSNPLYQCMRIWITPSQHKERV
jgi:hypothetical protein